MQNTRQMNVEWLTQLSNKEFAELIMEVVTQRPITSDSCEEEGHFVLATATKDRDEGTWAVEVVARPDASHYETGFDADCDLCQFGVCGRCDTNCVSWAKNIICSVCGEQAYCT